MPLGVSLHEALSVAANIMAFGIGAIARQGAFGLLIPMTREMDMRAAVHCGYCRI